MSPTLLARIRDRLRGTLPAESPGARGTEHLARNPECLRLRALTIVGIKPATAAKEIYRVDANEGMSTFALQRGVLFERRLLENGAARLLQLYRSAGRLSVAESKVVNVEDLAPGTHPIDMQRRRTETRRLFEAKLANDPGAPNLIVKPRIPIGLLGVGHDIEPDVLVAADEDRFYRPAEIKSYPDRAGKTDPADLRSIRRQAAVGVVALRQAGARLMNGVESLVGAVGDLVLTKPQSFTPTLHPSALRGEVDSIERALAIAPASLEEVAEIVGEDASLDRREVLDSIPNAYRQNCREHCALAAECKRQAIRDGIPAILGDVAREELVVAGSIGRAIDLMNERGRPPRNDEERVLQERLAAARRVIPRAVNRAG